jgi:Anti-sigma-K factor rskA
VKQSTVWPAYLVAAACFVIALISSMANIALIGQVKQAQAEAANLSERSTSLARSLVDERAVLSDIFDSRAKHHQTNDGEVITHGSRIYLALHDLPPPPRGKIYEAWTLAKGSSKMQAAPTFVPDAHGVALVVLPADARNTVEVAVTVEPDSGSKEPTSKPFIDVAFGSE